LYENLAEEQRDSPDRIDRSTLAGLVMSQHEYYIWEVQQSFVDL
jgi:hypothetical protein